jgi:3-keto-5-aminohexanoate cleavage enzyme
MCRSRGHAEARISRSVPRAPGGSHESGPRRVDALAGSAPSWVAVSTSRGPAPTILTCALVGGVESTNPHHPKDAADVIRHGIGAARAGASILHVHARSEDGRPTQHPDTYRLIAEGIRSEAPDVIVNFTSAGSPGMTDDERLGSLRAGPDLASLDAGSMNFGADDEFVFVNTHAFMARAATEMRELGIKPELECFDTGMIMAGRELVDRGLVPAPPLFQLVLGVRGGAPARVDTLTHLVALLPEGAIWSAFAVGRPHLEIMAATLALGGHIRTGMEDVAYVAAGVHAQSNAELVERAVAVCRDLGRPLATPEQAREILGLS